MQSQKLTLQEISFASTGVTENRSECLKSSEILLNKADKGIYSFLEIGSSLLGCQETVFLRNSDFFEFMIYKE